MHAPSSFGSSSSYGGGGKGRGGTDDFEYDYDEEAPLKTSMSGVGDEWSVEVSGDRDTFAKEVPLVDINENLVRKGFIRKVYGILTMQLLCTAFFCVLGVSSNGYAAFVHTHSWTIAFAGIASFVLLLSLLCFKDVYPKNLLLLSGFTLCESYLVGAVCAMSAEAGNGDAVAFAGIATFVLFVGLTAYVNTSGRDFSFLRMSLYSCLYYMLLYSLFSWVFHFSAGGELLYSCFAAAVFSLYIVYDTWRLSNTLGPDDYIVGAIELYLDIINLFLHLLRIISELKR